MGETGDRIDRAERYVLGLMDDEERERAEHDLEIDPAFREAMVETAERMHVFDRKPESATVDGVHPDDWQRIKERIEAMPQMRTATSVEPRPREPAAAPDAQASFGRRRSGSLPRKIVPETPARTMGTGLHSVPDRRALVLALALTAAFALGYVVGKL